MSVSRKSGGPAIITLNTQTFSQAGGGDSGSGKSGRTTANRERSLANACLCAQVADDFKGQETLVLDLTDVTPIMDYFVVSTATSSRQMRALAEEVNRTMRAQGSRRLGYEGEDGRTWILQDYGDVVLHIFSPEARALYDLEHLWGDAPRVDWKAYNSRQSAAPRADANP